MYCVRYDGCIACMGTVPGSGCTVLDMTVVSHIWGLLSGVDVLC